MSAEAGAAPISERRAQNGCPRLCGAVRPNRANDRRARTSWTISPRRTNGVARGDTAKRGAERPLFAWRKMASRAVRGPRADITHRAGEVFAIGASSSKHWREREHYREHDPRNQKARCDQSQLRARLGVEIVFECHGGRCHATREHQRHDTAREQPGELLGSRLGVAETQSDRGNDGEAHAEATHHRHGQTQLIPIPRFACAAHENAPATEKHPQHDDIDRSLHAATNIKDCTPTGTGRARARPISHAPGIAHSSEAFFRCPALTLLTTSWAPPSGSTVIAIFGPLTKGAAHTASGGAHRRVAASTARRTSSRPFPRVGSSCARTRTRTGGQPWGIPEGSSRTLKRGDGSSRTVIPDWTRCAFFILAECPLSTDGA